MLNAEWCHVHLHTFCLPLHLLCRILKPFPNCFEFQIMVVRTRWRLLKYFLMLQFCSGTLCHADNGNSVQERRGRGVDAAFLGVHLFHFHHPSLHSPLPAAHLICFKMLIIVTLKSSITRSFALEPKPIFRPVVMETAALTSTTWPLCQHSG